MRNSPSFDSWEVINLEKSWINFSFAVEWVVWNVHLKITKIFFVFCISREWWMKRLEMFFANMLMTTWRYRIIEMSRIRQIDQTQWHNFSQLSDVSLSAFVIQHLKRSHPISFSIKVSHGRLLSDSAVKSSAFGNSSHWSWLSVGLLYGLCR